MAYWTEWRKCDGLACPVVRGADVQVRCIISAGATGGGVPAIARAPADPDWRGWVWGDPGNPDVRPRAVHYRVQLHDFVKLIIADAQAAAERGIEAYRRFPDRNDGLEGVA